jgi:hypothetical protein
MQIHVDERPAIPPRELEIYDGFVLDIGWLPPKRRDNISRQAYYRRGQWQEHGDEAFARAYTGEVIRGWRGFRLDICEGYLKVKLTESSRAEVEAEGGEIPYSADNAVRVYRNAVAAKFAQKIRDFLEDWDDENDTEEQARKKDSSDSPASAPTPRIPRAVTSVSS